jgi:replicative DNA helicase
VSIAEREAIVRAHAITEYEQSLLNFIFNLHHNKENFARLCMIAQPGHFYSLFHGDVWATMQRVSSETDDDAWANPLWVVESLCDQPIVATRRWKLSEAIQDILIVCDKGEVYNMQDAVRFAMLIRDDAQQRVVKASMHQAMHATNRDDFHNALDDLRVRIADTKRPITGDIKTVWESLEIWKQECAKAKSGAAVTTGWPTIDKAFGLLRGGEVIIAGARAGVGKTWAGSSIALHNAERGQRSLLCSMEMTAPEIAERVAAQTMSVSPRDMRIQHESLNINDAREQLVHLDNIRIYDLPLSLNQIPMVIKQCQSNGFDPDIVIVDYLGLLKWEGNKNAMSYERASENARALKTIAKQVYKPILALAQLSREAGDGYEEPHLDMLRDSGAIEEAADRVLLLWKERGSVMMKVAKNRHGKEGVRAMLRYTEGLRLEELHA